MEISKRLITNPKKVFLIDAIGALISAFFLGIILVQFNSQIGMPIKTLYILAVLPCFFTVYSFSCYFFLKRNWRPFLRGIAIANSMYCFSTIGLMIFHFQELSGLGLFYFIAELIALLVLIRFEFKVASGK